MANAETGCHEVLMAQGDLSSELRLLWGLARLLPKALRAAILFRKRLILPLAGRAR